MSKTALFAAAKSWDSRLVRQLLMQSPDLVRARDPRGRTALHICAGASAASNRAPVAASLATARALLDAGAEINAAHEIPDGKEVFRATPLWYALARGQNGVTARDSKGCTAAEYARKKRLSRAVLTALGEQQMGAIRT